VDADVALRAAPLSRRRPRGRVDRELAVSTGGSPCEGVARSPACSPRGSRCRQSWKSCPSEPRASAREWRHSAG